MKAIILTAGVGSRIRPLTDDKPKFLLPIGQKMLGQIMIDNLLKEGVREFVIVTGHFADKVKSFLESTYPFVHFEFIHNPNYASTNTGYSLLLAEKTIGDDSFIKLDGDVLFEPELLKRLISHSAVTCLCMDTKIHLDKEEVKVIADNSLKVIEVGKKIKSSLATGESIGIEKIGHEAGKKLFSVLRNLMKKTENYQEYYDDSYTTLVHEGVPFSALDITGSKWVEVDTHEDYKKALRYFS